MHGIVHRFYYRDVFREAIHTIHFDFRYESAAGPSCVGVARI